MSSFWSWFIIILTAANIIGAVWLLLATAKNRHGAEDADTGHVWDDDLRELNKPLPRWWLGLFILTVVFAIVYLVLYPGMGNFDGTLGWTQEKQYRAQVEAAETRFADFYAPFTGEPIPELATNADAVAAGRNLFVNNCAACHGSDARGAPGYPNLRDDNWLYGGQPEQILTSILQGRHGMMPALGGALGDEKLGQVVTYVRSLSGETTAPAGYLADGREVFRNFCAACHGMEGRGNQALGAPDLADSAWLYGNSLETLRTTIMQGRSGRMPPHEPILGRERARLVAAYVWSLSHEEQNAE